MNPWDYLKERWLTLVFLLAALAFASAVYILDKNLYMTESNASYILAGWLLLFIVYIGIDYGVLRHRLNSFQRFCNNNARADELSDFSYPYDRAHSNLVHKLAREYQRYQGEIRTTSENQLEFITKWLHDVKVPIAAARLILESHEEEIPTNSYISLDREILAIEEAVQQVFYEIKANHLHDDYKIARVDTSKLVSNALKGYSGFFIYKQLELSVKGPNYQVLTDEKWSGYILAQFISNAVKYAPSKGKINIVTEQKDKRVTIAVTNSGQGIIPKDIGQVFDKGYTSSQDRSGAKATGYGLYLAKKLSDLLGHSLTARSEYGKYATFSLTFTEKPTIHQVTKM